MTEYPELERAIQSRSSVSDDIPFAQIKSNNNASTQGYKKHYRKLSIM